MIRPRLVYVYAATAPVTRGTGHLAPVPLNHPLGLLGGEPAPGFPGDRQLLVEDLAVAASRQRRPESAGRTRQRQQGDNEVEKVRPLPRPRSSARAAINCVARGGV
jgi:hypothetical protein